MKKIINISLLLLIFVPVFSSAQIIQNRTLTPLGNPPPVAPPIGITIDNCSNKNIQGLLICTSQIINKMIPLTASLALLYFLWGVSKIIRAQGDTKMIEEGRRTAFWGIIALFILASIGGITLFLQHDLLGGTPNTIPTK